MITTVCMNPSFDKTALVDRLVQGDVNRLQEIRVDAGGKGLNVATVLKRLGIAAQCVGCLGRENGESFLQIVETAFIPFFVPGQVRTNLKVLDTSINVVTELNEPGIQMDEEQLQSFLHLLSDSALESEYLVLSGSLPRGCGVDTYRRCMQAVSGKKCVVDTAGEALLHALDEKPYLIKPNQPELEALMQRELSTLAELREAALALVDRGAQNVVVSLGKHGAMLVTQSAAWFAPALPVEVRSTVGAGDSMLGGILAGLALGETLCDAFRFGVAAGAASVMTDGTQLITQNDFDQLLPKVVIQQL